MAIRPPIARSEDYARVGYVREMARKGWAAGLVVVLACCTQDPSGGTPSPSTGRSSFSAEALARLEGSNVVPVEGSGELVVDDVPPETTYDLRTWRYVGASGYPFTLGGDSSPAAGVVTVGGELSSDLPDRSWDYLYHQNRQAGDGIRVVATDQTATFDLTLRNVWDGYNPRVEEGTEQDNTVRFLLSGCYFDRVHDDAVENDDLMSGTVSDCLLDGIFVGFSEEPSEGNDYTNHASVLTLRDVIARFSPWIYDNTLGTGKVFKWSEAGGSVDAKDCIFYFEANTNQSISAQVFPPGTYEDVTIVLGPDFEGTWPVALPPGVIVTRDTSVFTDARDAWLERAGFPVPPRPS